MKRLVLTAALVLAAAACREDPGIGDYSTHEDLRARNEPPPFLPGPTPFVETVPRLSVGLFYENGFTEQVLVDGVSANYFIFDTVGDGSGQLTYSQETATDRIEGSASDRLIHAGTGFLGGGIFWDTARDVTRYSTLNVSLKSSDPAFAEVGINVESGEDAPAPKVASTVNATNYGYSNDGEWHSLTIPIADLEMEGFNPRRVRSPLFFTAGAGEGGESLLVDDVYYQ